MKEFNYFIDTNIFLRVLIKEDEIKFQQCRRVLELIRENKIKAWTSSLVLAEVNWTLVSFYKFSKEKNLKAIKSIISLKNLKIADQNNIYQMVHLYEKYNIKFIDAHIASLDLITQKNTKIISYDKDFDKLNVIRIEPAKLIKNI